MLRRAALVLLASLATACGGADPRFITEVLWFHPGPGAGQGQDALPAIVEGGPEGAGQTKGSLDVLSLGRGGEIAFAFGADIVDGDGPDFVIFENAFDYTLPGQTEALIFAELGEVSVSQDGKTWTTFPCQSRDFPYTGCAGWHAVLANAENGIDPLDTDEAGGDPFDLAAVGLPRARYVKIRDISNYGGGTTAGFDLDAAALIHPAP
jgi:hypothetical protein